MEALLQECETLNHSSRMRRMVEVGRNAATDAPTQTLVTGLLQGSLYERVLGLQTCYGSRNVAPALQALASPSLVQNTLSVNVIALLATDTEALEALLYLASSPLFALLVHRLRKRRRLDVIDASYEKLVSSRENEELLKWLLPFTSKHVIERWLPQVVDGFGRTNWARLVRFHPEMACKAIHDWAVRMNTLDPLLLQTVNEMVPRMVEFSPHLALDLVKLMLQWASLEELAVQGLLKKVPQEIADLVLESGERSNISFAGVAIKLQTRQLLLLYEHYPNTIAGCNFAKFTPELRLAIYQLMGQGWRSKEGMLPLHILGALPTPDRVAEARRNLELPALETRPFDKIAFAAFLPWDEAMKIQATYLRSNDADMRSMVLQSQISATRYDEARLGDGLQLVLQRRFEQDPVRLQMLTALTELPPGRWKEEHLANLVRIIRDALDAGDLSAASVQALLHLVIRVLLFHPAWSVGQLALIIRERDMFPHFFRLSGNSSVRDAMRLVADALLPIFETGHKREDESSLVGMALQLESRIRDFPKLLDILEQVLQDTRVQYNATDILSILAKHTPQRLRLLIPRLLELDPSCITLTMVRDYVHRRRQDLLTPYLGQTAYEGRFNTGRTRQVLPLDSGFQLWTMSQQELFARTLLEVLGETDRPASELQSQIKRLVCLCYIDASHLISFASDERPSVRETALIALGRLDARQGVSILLQALDDERARIAIYALRRVLKTMPKPEALKLLQAAPMTKVTVAKEVVRLIGDLESEDAYQCLLKMEKTELHPDVRVALLRGLWSYLARAETWEIFTRAAQDVNTNIPKALAHIPAYGLSTEAQILLVKLLALLMAHSQAEVRLEALGRCVSLPCRDPEQILVSQLFRLLQSKLEDEVTSAAKVVFCTYSETQVALIGEVFKMLLKDYKALSVVFEAYFQQLRYSRQRTLSATRVVLDVLKTDQLTLTRRLRLMFHVLPWKELQEHILALASALHADALVTTESLVEHLASRPEAQLSELELALASSRDEGHRRLALSALLAQTRQAKGWTDVLRARLLIYQKDESLLVAEAACFVFPPLKVSSASWDAKSRS